VIDVGTEPGYQAPSVIVSSSLPRRKAAETVLIVPVVSTDDRATVLAAEPFVPGDAVATVEDALRALGATGGEGQLQRLVIPSLPVASVLAVGLGAPRTEWPADNIRRAAGAAARSLDKVQSVATTLSVLDLGAAVE
jgi:leucyl aminopeptidase